MRREDRRAPDLGRRHWGLGLGAALAVAFTPRHGSAHPYHVSLTEAHHRPARRLLELSTRVLPEDMQEALRQAGHRELQVDALHASEPRRLDRFCAAYLRRRVILQTPDGSSCPLMLVGHELDARWMWLHYVLPVGEAADLGGFLLDARIFYEIAPAQTNTLVLHHGGKRETLTFRPSSPAGPIPAPS